MSDVSTDPPKTSGIVAENLCKTYRGGKVRALNGLSLEIQPGEAFGLIGPNGAGKTTFFGCLLAFLNPDEGQITIDGKRPDSLETRRIVGYLPERLNFDQWMTGREFLHYHHALCKRPKLKMQEECDELLAKVALPTHAWDLPIKKYSRGMLQRIGFAQALINRPKFLLLDEPASGVDPGGVLLVRSLLRELKGSGVTILLNSHQLEQVEKVCDRVAFINSGRVEAIENLQADTPQAKQLNIRWLLAENLSFQDDFPAVVAFCGAEVLEYEPGRASLALASEEMIAETIKSLVNKGFPLVHASSDDGRLEKYFLDKDSASSAEAKP